MPDLKLQDLGNGYRLIFQQLAAVLDNTVRAVVKDSAGLIVARGPVVPLEKWEITQRAAASEFAMTLAESMGATCTDFDVDEEDFD